ncbi:MAG: helix-turn-helix transcriptional regulator [Bacteroidetes bacterium]|nr:helix-turn-helix transcriptional regulator [Bacteroidota bacterium]
MNQIIIEIGKKVRKIRISLGFTQEQLAALSGLSNDYLSRLELGKESPKVETLCRICEALKVEIVELFLKDTVEPTNLDEFPHQE